MKTKPLIDLTDDIATLERLAAKYREQGELVVAQKFESIIADIESEDLFHAENTHDH